MGVHPHRQHCTSGGSVCIVDEPPTWGYVGHGDVIAYTEHS